jgi:uncharacterized protein YkwD
VLLLALTATTPVSACIFASDDICKTEFLISVFVGEYRAKEKLHHLNLSSALSHVARAHSKYQADKGRISHYGFSKGRYSFFKTEFGGWPVKIQRENVAMFSGTKKLSLEEVAKKFHTMWINSSGHRANIRAKDIYAIGVGVYETKNGYYATQLFGDSQF